MENYEHAICYDPNDGPCDDKNMLDQKLSEEMMRHLAKQPSRFFPHPSNIIHIFLFIQKKVVSLPPLLCPFPCKRVGDKHCESFKLLDISVVTPLTMQLPVELDSLRAHAGCPLALL